MQAEIRQQNGDKHSDSRRKSVSFVNVSFLWSSLFICQISVYVSTFFRMKKDTHRIFTMFDMTEVKPIWKKNKQNSSVNHKENLMPMIFLDHKHTNNQLIGQNPRMKPKAQVYFAIWKIELIGTGQIQCIQCQRKLGGEIFCSVFT